MKASTPVLKSGGIYSRCGRRTRLYTELSFGLWVLGFWSQKEKRLDEKNKENRQTSCLP